mmetsp:Transcript_92297/g.202146  ORF Transcript_92297/g.202146 Transcript_92297/m.202146 type:complete len:342 (-) Transcript_92297:101-1126(-)
MATSIFREVLPKPSEEEKLWRAELASEAWQVRSEARRAEAARCSLEYEGLQRRRLEAQEQQKLDRQRRIEANERLERERKEAEDYRVWKQKLLQSKQAAALDAAKQHRHWREDVTKLSRGLVGPSVSTEQALSILAASEARGVAVEAAKRPPRDSPDFAPQHQDAAPSPSKLPTFDEQTAKPLQAQPRREQQNQQHRQQQQQQHTGQLSIYQIQKEPPQFQLSLVQERPEQIAPLAVFRLPLEPGEALARLPPSPSKVHPKKPVLIGGPPDEEERIKLEEEEAWRRAVEDNKSHLKREREEHWRREYRAALAQGKLPVQGLRHCFWHGGGVALLKGEVKFR